MELFHLTIHALFVVFFVRRVEYVNFILEVKRIKKRLLRQHQEHMLHASLFFGHKYFKATGKLFFTSFFVKCFSNILTGNTIYQSIPNCVTNDHVIVNTYERIENSTFVSTLNMFQ